LFQCRLDALFALFGRAQPGRLRLPLGKAGGRLGLCLDRLHQIARLAQVFVQAGLAAERGRTGVGANAHAVLRHPLQADRTDGDQCGHVVGEQFVHQRFVASTEVVDRVVVHRHAPADPPVRVVLQAQTREFAPTAHAVQCGVQPKGEQDVRVDRRTTGIGAARLDRPDQFAQVLAHDVAPHQPGPMVLGQQRFQVRGPQFNLQPVGL